MALTTVVVVGYWNPPHSAVTLFARFLALVDVAAAFDGDVVGEELEGDDFEDGEEELGGGGDFEEVLDELVDVGVAFGGDGDDAAAARGDLLDGSYTRRCGPAPAAWLKM